jgi:hypothetical protein
VHKHIRLISALVLGMAVLLIPTLATAAPTINTINTVNVADQGLLVAKGAGVRVSVEVTCDSPGGDLFVDVILTQHSGNTDAEGVGGVSGTCDGTPQTFEFHVAAGQLSEKVFSKGPATAQFNVGVCDPSGCENTEGREEIQLVKK